VAAVLLVAASAGGQQISIPQATSIHWPDLQVVFSPDSSGVYIWASSGAPMTPHKVYSAAFSPAETMTWIADAKWFLDQKLTETDTGSTRSSPALSALERGGRLYVIRRRTSTEWSGERFLVFEQGQAGVAPVVVNADDRTIHAILDSMELATRRAPPFRDVSLRDSTGALIPWDKSARLRPGQKPPQYPRVARLSNRQGLVLTRFVIGTDGRAEMNSVRIIASAGEPFHKSVLERLETLEFEPATFMGKPVRQLVIMPFDFGLLR
jgi:TonB family protein